MGDADYVALKRRQRQAGACVTLFAPRVTPDGLHAPSACAHRDIRAGTRFSHAGHKYEMPKLTEGFHRPDGGLLLRRVEP